MPNIIEVRFRRGCKVYSFKAESLELKPGDMVVVETVRGQELGEVVSVRESAEDEVLSELKSALRIATAADIENAGNLPQREESALTQCAGIVERLNLPMKLISAEFNLDASHLAIYFSAENRVDFRELVRELSHALRARVEMRQIGPRDEAKLLGGYGRCGRELCCAGFLTEFNPVSIKMAKMQDLPLNPLKISGVCGRLLCCLGYEYDQYKQMKGKMPREGTHVVTESGAGVVIGGNVLSEKVLVGFESGARLEFPLAKIRIVDQVADEGKNNSAENRNPSGLRGRAPDKRA